MIYEAVQAELLQDAFELIEAGVGQQ